VGLGIERRFWVEGVGCRAKVYGISLVNVDWLHGPAQGVKGVGLGIERFWVEGVGCRVRG